LVNPYGDGAYTRTDTLRNALETRKHVLASRVLTGAAPKDPDQWIALAGQADCCLIAIVVKPAAWQSFGISPAVRSLIQATTLTCPTVVASLGVSEVLEEFPAAATRITTYSDVSASQQALIDWFFG
jgi:hypothetical protein